MARRNIGDTSGLTKYLDTHRHALNDLVADITVGETYFFRDRAGFDYIREHVLPGMLQDRPGGDCLRFWSAGCASGEEAYSLAILLEEEGLAGQARILATDISTAALAKARHAVYQAWSLRGSQPDWWPRYFRQDGDKFRLIGRIRRRVEFRLLNLAEDPYPGALDGTPGMDLILCRNVLIYLERRVVRTIAQRLFEALRSGGWLVTGPSDPPLWTYAPFEAVITPAGVLYRRRLGTRNGCGYVPRHGAVRPRSVSSAPMAGRPDLGPSVREVVEAPVASTGPTIRNLPSEAARRRSDPSDEPRAEPTITPIQAAQDALAAGEYARVLQLTESCNPDPPLCILRLKALANLAGIAAAEKAAAAAALRYSLHPEIHYLHAIMLISLGRQEEALAALNRVLYLDRSLAVAHLTAGSICRARGEIQRARRAFRNAHALLSSRPADEIVPLSERERAGDLIEIIRTQIGDLEAAS